VPNPLPNEEVGGVLNNVVDDVGLVENPPKDAGAVAAGAANVDPKVDVDAVLAGPPKDVVCGGAPNAGAAALKLNGEEVAPSGVGCGWAPKAGAAPNAEVVVVVEAPNGLAAVAPNGLAVEGAPNGLAVAVPNPVLACAGVANEEVVKLGVEPNVLAPVLCCPFLPNL
jgi:hypothetical protein